MTIAGLFLATVQPDGMPGRQAPAPYTLAVAPKKMPTITPVMNFATSLTPTWTSGIIAWDGRTAKNSTVV